MSDWYLRRISKSRFFLRKRREGDGCCSQGSCAEKKTTRKSIWKSASVSQSIPHFDVSYSSFFIKSHAFPAPQSYESTVHISQAKGERERPAMWLTRTECVWLIRTNTLLACQSAYMFIFRICAYSSILLIFAYRTHSHAHSHTAIRTNSLTAHI